MRYAAEPNSTPLKKKINDLLSDSSDWAKSELKKFRALKKLIANGNTVAIKKLKELKILHADYGSPFGVKLELLRKKAFKGDSQSVQKLKYIEKLILAELTDNDAAMKLEKIRDKYNFVLSDKYTQLFKKCYLEAKSAEDFSIEKYSDCINKETNSSDF